MIHATIITKSDPLLGFEANDVVLEEEGAPYPVALFRGLPESAAHTVSLLVEQGSAIRVDGEAVSLDAYPEQRALASALALRSGQDRRRLHLRLEA